MAFMETSVSATLQVSFDDETDHDDNESKEQLDCKAKYETLFQEPLEDG